MDPETGDEGDIAIREEQLRLLFRQIRREPLLPKYDAALMRLEKENMASAGYGEPIGLQRCCSGPPQN